MPETVIQQLSPRLEPADACARFLDLPYCLLLESTAKSKRFGRYSFLAADPFLAIRSKGTIVEQIVGERAVRVQGDPFDVLQSTLARHTVDAIPGLPPFQGGAAGFFAYDLGHHLETLPSPRYDDLGLPDLCIGLYDWVLVWDHLQKGAWLVSTGQPAPVGLERRARAAARADAVWARLCGSDRCPFVRDGAPPSPLADGPTTFPLPGVPGVSSTFSRGAYLEAVERTREYIRAGDVFQTNISQRLQTSFNEHPFLLYKRLRRCNPTPFAAYFDIGEATVVSASPERFLHLKHGQVETRPIKGTAPRGDTSEQDVILKSTLRRNEKDRAENVMIVDLLRNDLSRVSQDHTVQVPELCVVESYSTVHHLVSTIIACLRSGLGAVDLLRATFPGGSVTGAPKVRAMEIIAELEPTRRNVYTGGIGYIGFDGTMDISIAIRTFVLTRETAFFQVGGGIVIDSNPNLEYLETLAKAKGLLIAQGLA